VGENWRSGQNSRRVVAPREEEETSHVELSLNRLLHSNLGISRPSDSAHFLKCLLHTLLYFSGVAVLL
jgi:hypothetical protein